MKYMFDPLRKYAQFQGRAHRAEYWQFILFYAVVYLVLMAVVGAAGQGAARAPATGLVGLFALAMFVPHLAVGVRRLHDTERSGWWLLIGLVPLLGAIVLLIFFVIEGTKGQNKFGPDPKEAPADAFA